MTLAYTTTGGVLSVLLAASLVCTPLGGYLADKLGRRWPAVGGNTVLRFGVLEGVQHQYPNGRNNPEGFAAAPEFWDFFAAHRLR